MSESDARNSRLSVEDDIRVVSTGRVCEWVLKMRGSRRDERGRKVLHARCVEGPMVRIELAGGRREKEMGLESGGVALDT